MPRTALQPIYRFAILALGFHVLVGAAWWFHRANHSAQPPPKKPLTWISPVDFQPSRPLTPSAAQVTRPEIDSKSLPAVVGVPKAPPQAEPVPKAIAIDPAKAMKLLKAQPKPADEPLPPMDGSRFITVSKREAGSGGDDKGGRLDEVDRAIIDAFLRNWTPPNANTLSMAQRTAHMDVTVDRTGRVLNFKLAKRSDNDNFDLSVLEAANRLDKIDARLPPSYPRDHYEFQVHFHVE